MNFLSKLSLTVFELLNELYIAVGAGVIGIVVLVNHGYKSHQLIRTLSVVSITLGSLVFAFQASTDKRKPGKKQVVFITGCDSGLGFSLALHTAHLGFTVIAGFLSVDSTGALEIKRLCKEIKQIELDVTKRESVFVAVETVRKYLEKTNSVLYGVINNAAVMVFGEFEWQTESLIHQQIAVNLSGTLNLSRAVMPILRKHRGRIILVTSHCSCASLPGLAVYGATKAGLQAFGDGLRVEVAKYGVKVVQFTPGSFIMQSNIMGRHRENVVQMQNGFTEEQHKFYDDYFYRYNAHLLAITPQKFPQKIVDKKLYSKFEEALLHNEPYWRYKVEPFRYAFYHFIFKYSPVSIRDLFVLKFMNMPEYNATDEVW